jgi:hypothetical protein
MKETAEAKLHSLMKELSLTQLPQFSPQQIYFRACERKPRE